MSDFSRSQWKFRGENSIIYPMWLLLFFPLVSHAFQNYTAERDPPLPKANEQYRLILRTPDRNCDSWRKIVPLLEKADMLISQSKREEKSEKGVPLGCRFLWVITPAAPPGAMKFELEGNTGPKEMFEMPAPAGYRPPAAIVSGPSVSGGIPGVADENGTGPATQAPRGSVRLPGIGVDGGGKPADPGTGK